MLVLGLIWTGTAVFTGTELFRFMVAGVESERAEGSEPAAEDPEPAPEDVDDAVSEQGEGEGEGESEDLEDDTFKKVEQSLGLSVGALSLSLVGHIVPIAHLVSIPLLIAGIVPLARDAWHNFKAQKRVDYLGLSTVGALFEIGMGYTTLAAFGWLVYTGGQHLQLRTRRKVAEDFSSAFEDMNERAWVSREGVECEIPLADLSVDDRVIVRAGDAIPVDGVIVDGAIVVDQRALTGESRLFERGEDDEVYAATLVLSGAALVRPLRTGPDTIAARIQTLLDSSISYEQSLRDRAEQESDRTVRPTFLLMGLGGVASGVRAALTGFWTNAIELSWFGAPYSVMNTIEAAARSSIVIKDGRSLEQLAHVDTVVFDKTGTLTLDSFAVFAIHLCAEFDEMEILALAASLEQRQQHPIGRAIVAAAERAGIEPTAPEDLTTDVGFGLRASVDGVAVLLGSLRLMSAHDIDVSSVADSASEAEAGGNSTIYLARGDRCVGMIELAPQLRPEAVAVVEDLRARGLDLMLVSGDAPAPCAALARRLGIATYHAQALPEDKVQIIADLQAEGRRVCFIGDGINDGLALKRANVSISMTGSSAVAMDSAQVLMQSGSLDQLDALFQLAARFEREQRVIFSLARGITVASGLAFLVFSIELKVMVWLYITGLGATLTICSLPKLRASALSTPARSIVPSAPAQ